MSNRRLPVQMDVDEKITSRLGDNMIVRHELARYDIPNEQVRQTAGQRQNADNIETMRTASYERTFSANAL